MRHSPPVARPYPRLSAAVCGLVALSLSCGVAGTAGASVVTRTDAIAVPDNAPAASATPTDDAAAKAQAEATATAQAKRTGVPVPVPELTTETDTVTALPNGNLALKRTIEPARTKKTGTWRELDPTLAKAADGTVRPASTTGDLVLGGGGSKLLASMTNNGRKLTLSWPTTLPKPVLAGDGALYPGVLPDVDLKVVAGEQGGFTHTLIVKTAEAARNPRLATLQLGMDADGLTVGANSDGSLAAKSPDGKVAFIAPAASMWDSRTTPKATGTSLRAGASADAAPATAPGTELASTDRQPGARASVAPLKAEVADGTLSLTPDAGLLSAPDTVFPLYIDPPWVPLPDNVSTYGWAQEAYPDTPGYGRTDFQPGAGYQHYRVKTGLERTYYRVDYNWQGRLNGKAIKRVVFNTTQVDSAIFGCEQQYAQPVELHLTNDTLTTGTNWDNKPTELGLWGTASVPSSSTQSKCGNRLVDFDITSNVLPHQNWEFLTLSVHGKESPKTTSNDGFKRFSRTAADNYIYIEYNTPPNVPKNTRMTPVPVNGGASGNAGYIGAVNPAVGGVSLFATLTDPDGHDVDANFAIREVGNGNPLIHESGWISRGPSGHEARADIPAGKLLDGHTYNWGVVAGDGDLESGWVPGQTFTVDGTPPTEPTIASTDFPVNGGGNNAGSKGTFTLTATDNASGVDAIEYALNGPIPVGGAARATYDAFDNTWRIKDLPVGLWGTNHLFAQTVDKAGNRSQPTDYTFYAPSDPKATTTLGDIDGDKRIDLLIPDDTGALRMYAANTNPADGGVTVSTRVQGPVGVDQNATWTGALITHRGGAGIFRDNLYALGSGQLYLYRNNGPDAEGKFFAKGTRRSTVARPSATRCVDPTNLPSRTCTGYKSDWSQVLAILAVGNVDADVDEAGGAKMELLTVEQDASGVRRVWLFHGTSSASSFDHATLIGSGNAWNNLDLLAPGDTTGDQLPDLWARDRTTGQVYQYPSKKNADGTVDVTALGNTTTRTLIGTGLDAAAYPKLNSDGDLDGDGKGDLWAQATDGRLAVALGTTRAPDGNSFAPMRVIADNQTPWDGAGCEEFPSAGDANVKLKVCGPILAKYKAIGGVDGPLRLPTTGVLPDGKGGKYVNFQGTVDGGGTNGHINWSPTTGAWYQHGAARHKWLESGGVNGPLGYPVSDETTIRSGAGSVIGWITHYAGTPTGGPGAITWTDDTGGHVITGDTYSRWQAIGGPQGTLGFPATDVANTPTKPGTYTLFRTPGASTDTGSIYTSPETGAWAVYGNIRARWAALNWEQGWLGFPTGNEYDVPGGRRSDFQGGYIRWNATTNISTEHHYNDSTAAQRSEYSGDFDGDHRADVLTVYDYGQGTTALFVSSGTSDGGVGAPRQAWLSHAGWFDSTRAKFAVGDFDQDGRDDVVALYGYPDGATQLFTFLSRPDGSIADGVPSNYTAPGRWDWTKAVLLAGDFNGDGRDEPTMMYDHGSETTNAYTWPTKADGTFEEPVATWQSGAWNWSLARSKFVTGDFDGDGRTDLAAMYGYGNTEGDAVALFTLRALPDGHFAGTTQSWSRTAGNWSWNRTRLTTGDYNSDGRVDIAAMYDHGNGVVGLMTFTARTDGGFNDDVAGWTSAAGTWPGNAAVPVSGDYNGDGRADVAAMFEATDGSTEFHMFAATPDGTFPAPVKGWKATPGTW
ncbi:FG-GAP-like repeat-containing protein (plasmid) [Embleya sp. NBC_00888]|uniref:FG-GAP-like repeat-containing protein n=1 Tax=Embleya sp. NBC_00888 TaxID=2975960 RepID=UPI002F918312|nr:FG-GAP-like repeat-containing protein [Embleya sp. NBC_00888]